MKPSNPWPLSDKLFIEELLAKAKAEFERDVDHIEGIPHVVRLIPKDPTDVGSEKLRKVELFMNWLATKDDYAFMRDVFKRAFDQMDQEMMFGGPPP